ncbi:MAG: cytochrome c [Myxococcota bacterium]|jgi:mono/diheme cytochrome c family protein|nr:cytochrome c [Myxococcota bacterium]
MKITWGLAWLALIAASLPAARLHAETPSVAEDYVLHCSACHGRDGTGSPGLVPSLGEIAPLLGDPRGRVYLASVPGVAQAPLSDARIARLLNWVLDEYANTRVTPPYSAGEVAELRASPLRDPLAFRATLVLEDVPRGPTD